MKYVYEKYEDNMRHPYDVERIVRIFEDRGHEVSAIDAHDAWSEYSESMAAGWMSLHDDDEAVFQTAICYLKAEL